MCLLFHVYEYRNQLCVCGRVGGGGGCGIFLFFYISFEIKGFQDSRLFPIYTLEFNR